jgi:hypothetical protein
MQLQSEQALASRAPLAIKDADTAVTLAEQPLGDPELAAHRVYIADRKVEIARAEQRRVSPRISVPRSPRSARMPALIRGRGKRMPLMRPLQPRLRNP